MSSFWWRCSHLSLRFPSFDSFTNDIATVHVLSLRPNLKTSLFYRNSFTTESLASFTPSTHDRLFYWCRFDLIVHTRKPSEQEQTCLATFCYCDFIDLSYFNTYISHLCYINPSLLNGEYIRQSNPNSLYKFTIFAQMLLIGLSFVSHRNHLSSLITNALVTLLLRLLRHDLLAGFRHWSLAPSSKLILYLWVSLSLFVCLVVREPLLFERNVHTIISIIHTLYSLSVLQASSFVLLFVHLCCSNTTFIRTSRLLTAI
jgi:hypothetical protein